MDNKEMSSDSNQKQEVNKYLESISKHELIALSKKLSLTKYSKLNVSDLRLLILEKSDFNELYKCCFNKNLNQKWFHTILKHWSWGTFFTICFGILGLIIYCILKIPGIAKEVWFFPWLVEFAAFLNQQRLLFKSVEATLSVHYSFDYLDFIDVPLS